MKPTLHERMLADLTVAGKAPRTCDAYAACVTAFDRFIPVPLDSATRDHGPRSSLTSPTSAAWRPRP